MKASVLLPALLVLSITSLTAWDRSPITTVRPLVWQASADAEKVNACTTWPTVYRDRVVWVTALHCVVGENGLVDEQWIFKIDGKPATVLKANPEHDLVMLTGPSKRALRVSFLSPSPLDPVWTVGFPGGNDRPYVTAGVLSLVRDEGGRAVWNTGAASGMSGSPVLDKEGFVVGIIQQILCSPHGFCPMSRGVGVSELHAFLT